MLDKNIMVGCVLFVFATGFASAMILNALTIESRVRTVTQYNEQVIVKMNDGRWCHKKGCADNETDLNIIVNGE